MEDGKPKVESLNNVLAQISKTSGKGQILEGAYIESDNFNVMNDYANRKLMENSDENRTPYNVLSNNCGTFANDVIKQDKSVNAPNILDPRPVSIIDEYQSDFTSISYDPQKGTAIKYDNKTIKYNTQSNQTVTSQSWWQKLWYGRGEN